MASKIKELGQSYELVFTAAVTEFLAQARGARSVRVVAVESGAAAPADDSSDYFKISNQAGGTNAIGRHGMDNQDIYMRSDSDKDKAYITGSPLA